MLVATAHVALSVSFKPGLSPALYSSGFLSTTSHVAHTPNRLLVHTMKQQQQQQRQGSNLWWRRHRKEARGISVHLTPVDTGVPEIVPHDLSPADSASIAAGAQQKDKPRARSNRSGLLVLSTVPLVWGTYGPSVKYLYQMGESTPGLVFNFACYAVSVLTLAAVAGINNARKREGGFELSTCNMHQPPT